MEVALDGERVVRGGGPGRCVRRAGSQDCGGGEAAGERLEVERVLHQVEAERLAIEAALGERAVERVVHDGVHERAHVVPRARAEGAAGELGGRGVHGLYRLT